MNFKNMAYSFLSIALLLAISVSDAIVTPQSGKQGPTITGVVGGAPTTTSLGGGAPSKVGGMSYNDITHLVEFAKPFKFLDLRALSFNSNPTTGYLALHVPYQMTNAKQTDPNLMLVGTVPASKTGSQGDNYIYVHKEDVSKIVTVPKGGLFSGLLGGKIPSFGPGHPLSIEPEEETTAGASTAPTSGLMTGGMRPSITG